MRYVAPRHVVVDDAPTPCPYWEPDRVLFGATVLLVGGGPSHARLDLDQVRGWPLIAVNSACRKVQPIATHRDMLVFADNSWNENRPELARAWPGPVISVNRNAKARLGDAVRYLDINALTARLGVLPDWAQASSGHIAAALAAVMGARRLVLVGFECRAIAGRTHGHGDYSQHDVSVFGDRFVPGWVGLAPALARLGLQVVNATPDSAIPCFPFIPLDEALA